MTFFDKYSFRQKNIALAILTVLMIAAAYKRSFSVTIETKNYRNELEQKLYAASNADQDIRLKQLAIAHLNRFLGEENNSVEKVQQGFLNFFAKNANGLSVHQIDEILNFKHPDFEINTHRVVLKGDYVHALQFIYTLEKEFTLAKILNIEFEFKRYSMEDEKHLYTTILIQNYLK